MYIWKKNYKNHVRNRHDLSNDSTQNEIYNITIYTRKIKRTKHSYAINVIWNHAFSIKI